MRGPVDRLTAGLPKPWRVAIDWAVTIVGAVAIVLAIKQWVVNPYRIPSSSMEPTLHCARPGLDCQSGWSDRVLANRFIYHLKEPERGDIVVFDTPDKVEQACNAGGTFVKRIIGLPGEVVTVEDDGDVLIGKRKIDETAYLESEAPGGTPGQWEVPADHFFVMGDNRDQSCDSRQWGSLAKTDLIGEVFAVYWPLDRIGLR